jgi:uncharacterized protein DUF4339
MEWWYIAKDGRKTQGPFTEDQIRQLIKSGEVKDNTLVWHEGLSDLHRAEEMPEFVFPETDRSDSSSNCYFAQHWRGELSLAQSYWVNTFFLSIIAVTAVKTLSSLTDKIEFSDHPTFLSITFISFWLVAFLITPWQLVGLWRSASNHVKQTSRVFWPRVSQFIVVLGVSQSVYTFFNMAWPQIDEVARIAVGLDPVGKYGIRVSPQGTEIELSGAITFGLTDDVRQQLNANPNIRIIQLNSIGGRIGEARKLRDLISSRHLTTYTSEGCASACVLAFLGGRTRVLREGAQLGFHRPSFPGIPDHEMQDQVKIDKHLYWLAGVAPGFIERAFAIPSTDLWTPSSQELLQAHVITNVSDGPKFSKSELTSWENSNNVENSFLEIPLFQKLKTLDPQMFHKTLRHVQELIKLGEPRAQCFEKARQFVVQEAGRYFFYAEDGPLLEWLAVIARELHELRTKNGALCYALLFRNPLQKLDLTIHLSEQVKAAETAALTRIIESGAPVRRKIPTAHDVEKELKAVGGKISTRYGEDASKLSPQADKTKTCDLSIAVYEEILKLPQREGANMLRYILANPNALPTAGRS